MKRPEFSKKFWTITLCVSGLILIALIIWDMFFRYPKPQSEQTPEIYRAVVQ
jgi:plastocyanin domain-containing protein